ncbi:hypothetical protein GO150_000863 [Salmonella enterica subsp. diarizonae]|nr:hypothetical protein [Salmonella enterica subsp. diarizonae]MJB96724.1 hypothetical protein [Salmonella enterica subsp. diarizonae]
MKKTLIALAVAASAVVSSSAMAWNPGGAGGSFDIGGTLTPEVKGTPWVVKVGGMTGLNASITKGAESIAVPVTNDISILGIRTQTAEAFPGQAGISPRIDYHGNVNLASGSWGKVELSLPVLNSETEEKIGTLRTLMQTGGGVSVANSSSSANDGIYSVRANNDAYAFYGGLPHRGNNEFGGALNIVKFFDGEVDDNFNFQGFEDRTFSRFKAVKFDEKGTYSAFYGSGIATGETFTITLDSAAAADQPINWKSSMPITVTYQ